MGPIVKLNEENLYGLIYTVIPIVKMIKEFKLVYLNLNLKMKVSSKS